MGFSLVFSKNNEPAHLYYIISFLKSLRLILKIRIERRPIRTVPLSNLLG